MTIWPLLLSVSICDPAPAMEGKRFFDQGKFAEAEAQFRRAVNQSCGAVQRLADRINLAATLRERNALAEAKEVLKNVADLNELPVDSRIAYWNCFALIEEQLGYSAQAESAYRKALALINGDTPRRLTLQVWTNFARQRMRQGRIDEAERAMQQAREQPGWQHDRPLAFDLNLAELRRMQGRTREAEQTLRTLLRENRQMPTQMRGAVANNLASLAAARGSNREAESLWRDALRELREAYGPSHPIVAKSLNNLAAHYVSRKRFAEAEPLYREAIAMQEDPILLNNLATLLHRRGRLSEAEALYRRAVSVFELRPRPDREALQLHGNLAALLAETARVEDALTEFQAVLQLLPLAVPADEPAVARYLETYEIILRKRSDSVEAERVAAIAMRYRVRSALRAEN
ncbi:MAG: tetratricopeptide repeat protein [Acidobacteria bacterium]|nr:tetratricopeptide repeat protein [Acidobacteriota bacterium]